MTDLADHAAAWRDADPDPDTRAELGDLLAAADDAALAARFTTRLPFGTAGIRGPLGAGPARMNRLVVRQVTAGLARRLAGEAPGGRVVVGRDARHKSEAFAADAAAVLAAAGFEVVAFDRPVPTPLVAFCVRHLDAAAGVQITASHNPPTDNGYKVYWRGGAQIVAPLDAEIDAGIDAVDPLGPIPLGTGVGRVDFAGAVAAYTRACLALPRHPEHRDLRITYTPLHGVARDVLDEVFSAAGFADVSMVAAQAEPDPDFPTVSFPNPEEPGALDLCLAEAEATGADLVLANDPDGDRIAAAAPGGEGWRVLTGDETGCVLADYLLAGLGPGPTPVVATTVVSSQLLARIAEHHGAEHHETLTGFKWLAPVAAATAAGGKRFVLAYEQALGVMAGDAVRDKDGISAALLMADLAAWLKVQGRTILDALDDLARRHGVHATTGRSLRLEGADGPALVTAVLERLRSAPPADIEGVQVTAVADHIAGTRTLADGRVGQLATPPTDLVGLTLADGSRLQVRPSGTEPLLKFYVEVVEPVTGGDVATARHRAAERLEHLADTFLALSRPG